MNCSTLANTGSPLGVIVVAALACLAIGGLVLLAARHRRARPVITALVLAGTVLTAGVATQTPAHADTVCVSSSSVVTVRQVEPIIALAPGVAATPVVGSVTNIIDQAVQLTSVTVSISGVTKAVGAVPGPCDASDFVLTNPTMAVNQQLAPGASASFAGASLAFNDKSVNQDSCQGATLTLLYTTA